MPGTRENFLIAGAICIVAGAFFTVANIMSIAGTVGISGIVLFVLGMSIRSEQGMSDEEITNWKPDSAQLPDAGRVMYRVDITLDEPKKCTVMCGPCGHIELIDGDRPSQFTCPACSTFLWDEEE
jgi:hypothetical protein